MATSRKSPSTKKVTPAAKAPAQKPTKPPTASPSKAAVAAKAVVVTNVPKPEKPKKPKLVRDSFTIPKPEYVVLDELKQRSAALATPVKKSELLRAGIKALAAMSDAALLAAIKAVPAIKTGRPAAP